MTATPADLAALHGLTGSAYRWYADPAAIRADDLLVRSRVSQALCRTATALRDTEQDTRRAMPAPSREHPFPDPVAAGALTRLRAVHDRILALETRLRGSASLPDRDFSTAHGVSPALRGKLVRCDADLIAASDAVARMPLAGMDAALTALSNAIEARAAVMALRACV